MDNTLHMVLWGVVISVIIIGGIVLLISNHNPIAQNTETIVEPKQPQNTGFNEKNQTDSPTRIMRTEKMAREKREQIEFKNSKKLSENQFVEEREKTMNEPSRILLEAHRNYENGNYQQVTNCLNTLQAKYPEYYDMYRGEIDQLNIDMIDRGYRYHYGSEQEEAEDLYDFINFINNK